MKNRHGLSRNIPEDVKRQVRRECGFGCVLCGAIIIEYEHIEPPFAEAKQHLPDRIALLCPKCHAELTRGYRTKDSIMEARKSPVCQSHGFSSELFRLGSVQPRIAFAGSIIENTPIPIMIQDTPILEIFEAEESGGPFGISGVFYNSDGELSLEIQQNEWIPYSLNWDVEVKGGSIIIREAPRSISLKLNIRLPNWIEIECLDMLIKNYRITGNQDEFTVILPDGRSNTFSGCIASNCGVGFKFD